MSTGIKVATRIQIGVESTRGTAVNATRKLLGKSFTYRYMETFEEFEDQIAGVLSRSAQAPVLVRNGTEFEMAIDLDFDQILLPLLSGVKGGVTPSTPGAALARLWTFTPSMIADPLPKTFTLEFAERDMDSSPNELPLETTYAFTTAFEITGGREQVPQLSVSMVGRSTKIVSSTGSLTLPTLSYPSNLKWKVYFDSSWANLGNTQITGQIYAFTYSFSDFLRPVYYLDGRSDLDFSNYEFKTRIIDLSMDVVLGAASGDLVPTEDALKTAGTQRFVRLEILGAAFAGDDSGRNRTITLDGCYFHAPDSMQDRGQDDEGNTITRVHLKSTYDSVQAQDVEIKVENNIATFP